MFVCAATSAGAVGATEPLLKGEPVGTASAPTLSLIGRIEANLKLQRWARQLDSYVRYYSTETVAGVVTILGTFVIEGVPGRVVIVSPDQMPYINDGGCDVIEMRYSPADGKVLALSCHGYA
jgi:hypothetical protein